MVEEAALDSFAHKLGQMTPQEWTQDNCRRIWDQGSLTVCNENDISGLAKPVMEGDGFDLYLIDASQHCACLTNDFERACGVVVALHDEEDD